MKFLSKNTPHMDQSGRSMVEMLGTLAIIGVLSIGAIAGYSYAIDKYRANTIINDVMLRSVDAKAQFDATGDADLSEWPSITAGKYAIGLEDDTIGIQVEGIEKRLCEMVFDGMRNDAIIKIGAIQYDSVADIANCDDINTMVFYIDDASLNTTNTGNETNTDTDTETETETTTTVKKCTSHEQCMLGQYCSDANTSCTEAHVSGLCSDIQFYQVAEIDGKKYYLSGAWLSWWDANNWCMALGAKLGKNLSMITVPELVTNNDGSEWISGSGSHTLTELAKQLYSRLKRYGDGCWTSNLFNNSSNSCYAYFVYLDDGDIHKNSRENANYGNAICR